MSTRQQNWLLSGGIGSGKSTVRKILASQGVATIDADSIGHEILGSGGAAAAEVLEVWPGVENRGRVDRKALATIVFADPSALRTLESITHPHIFELLSKRVGAASTPLVIEIPLLAQPLEKALPRIVVDAPDSVRLERAVGRGLDAGDVLRRMESQPSRSEWLAAANIVIPNAGSVSQLTTAARATARLILSVESKLRWNLA